MECCDKPAPILRYHDAGVDDTQYVLTLGSIESPTYTCTAIGLQDRFKSLQWVATIPPMVIIIVFKWVLTYKFDNAFRYYVPTPEELKSTKIHSSQGDIKGHRLENRFGHPALHAELFTPMLHADMMPLLRQVYGGAVTEDKSTTKLKEYGGQRMPTQMIDGLKIAAVARVCASIPLTSPSNYLRSMNWSMIRPCTNAIWPPMLNGIEGLL